MPKKRGADALDLEERLERAKARTDALVDHVRNLFLMHEANAIVIYSPTLREQIPASQAGWAFNQFQNSMHLFEMIRLAAVWDSYGEHRESIPTIIDLIDHPQIIDKVVQRTKSYYETEFGITDLNPSDDPEMEAWKAEWFAEEKRRMAKWQANATRRALRFSISKARGMARSRRLQGLRRLRNRALAHNLDFRTAIDPDAQSSGLRYGDERYLLEQARQVTDALHIALNGAGFMWDDARKGAERQARALWDHCRFEVKD